MSAPGVFDPAKAKAALKRTGCPVEEAPQFDSNTKLYSCRSDQECYNLPQSGFGGYCCRQRKGKLAANAAARSPCGKSERLQTRAERLVAVTLEGGRIRNPLSNRLVDLYTKKGDKAGETALDVVNGVLNGSYPLARSSLAIFRGLVAHPDFQRVFGISGNRAKTDRVKVVEA